MKFHQRINTNRGYEYVLCECQKRNDYRKSFLRIVKVPTGLIFGSVKNKDVEILEEVVFKNNVKEDSIRYKYTQRYRAFKILEGRLNEKYRV